MKSETRLMLLGLGTWFSIAVVVGITGVFRSASASVVALTVWTLTALILLAWSKIPPLGRWATSVDLSCLIGLHLTRFVGFYFLLLCRTGTFSCTFAKPAGIG